MLSHLDYIIFPDRCEVLEMVPSQRYFYPIFKNGSSSILQQARTDNWRVYVNEQIGRIPSVDVVVRNPQQRFVSGINSFVTQTLESYPELDKNTVFWFAKNYLHINRHYGMQFSWLLNLARYLGPTAKINLLGLDDIKQFTGHTLDPWGNKDAGFEHQLQNTPAQEMYNRVDQVLVNAIGQSLTFSEIVEMIKTQDADAYKKVIAKAQTIIQPTYALPKA